MPGRRCRDGRDWGAKCGVRSPKSEVRSPESIGATIAHKHPGLRTADFSPVAERLLRLPHDHLPRVSHPIDRQLGVVDAGGRFGSAVERAPIPERDVVTTRDLAAVEDFTLPTLEDRYRDDLDENVVDLQADIGQLSVGTLLGSDAERDQGRREKRIRGVLAERRGGALRRGLALLRDQWRPHSQGEEEGEQRPAGDPVRGSGHPDVNIPGMGESVKHGAGPASTRGLSESKAQQYNRGTHPKQSD